MKSIPSTCLLSLVILVTSAPICEGDSFRCGRKLIRTGDSRADVLRVCGQPIAKDRGRANVHLDGAARDVPVERLHYKQSSRSLARIVNIYRGQVVSIEVGSR